jgi:uncharacterized protein YdiU (UPF0061 family)
LAQALLPLVESAEPLEAALTQCADDLSKRMDSMLCQKLGFGSNAGEALELARAFPAIMADCQLDMTNTYRALIDLPHLPDNEQALASLVQHSYASELDTNALTRWLQSYQRVQAEEARPADRRREQMSRVNPKFILRNYMAQLAIESAEAGDLGLLHELHQLIREPYAEQPGKERWTEKRPDWAAHKPGCSMLSCSS